MKKEKKKITDKEKIERKQMTIKIVKRIFHVLGYVSLVSWGLLGLLYACGVSKQKQQANNVVEKQPNRAYNPLKNYSANIITTPNDISDSDIYGGVYGSPVLSPYRAYNDFSQVLDNSASSTRYIANNSVSSYTILHTLFYDNYGNYKGDRDFSIDIRTVNNTVVVFEGYRINTIDFITSASDRCIISINLTNLSTGVTTDNPVFNCIPSSSPYPYGSGSPTSIPRRCIVEAFSGRYFIPKAVTYSEGFYGYDQFRRFVYLFSQYSIHNLSFSFKDDIDFSLIVNYFNTFHDGATVASNIYKGLVLNCYLVTNTSLEGNYYVLEGDFYLNNNYYNQMRFYYSYHSFTDGHQGYEDLVITVNGITIGGGISNSYAYGWLYLSDISLANTLSNNITQIAYPVSYNWAGGVMDIKTGINLFNGNLIVKGIIPSYKYGSDYPLYSNSYYDYQYNYLKILNVFNVYNNFNFSLVNGEPYIQIYTEGDNGISNYTGNLIDVFSIINIGFGGLTNLFNYMFLPGISLGVLLAIPLTLTIVLFVIKLFKR